MTACDDLKGGYLKVADVARLLKVSKSTVYTLMDKGLLRSVHFGKQCRRIPFKALEEYVNSMSNQ